ncbi:Zinc finger CCCH domain-containing protein 3 [Halocaridina rubra]|uniref:Zinc finger CCCH domain-containing protein 3 n=1 Tax=Halocaridina rubra TaxID=373956 RepID=A0AAN9AGU3_HALRR
MRLFLPEKSVLNIMANSEKKKIHINPDFINKRTDVHVQSRVHVNPAFFRQSSAQLMTQKAEFGMPYHSSSSSLHTSQYLKINNQTQTSTMPTNRSQSQTLKTCQSPHKRDQFTISHNGRSLAKVSSSSLIQNHQKDVPLLRHKSIASSKSTHLITEKTPSIQGREASINPLKYTKLNMSESSLYTWKASKSTPNNNMTSAISSASRNLKNGYNASMSFSVSNFKHKFKELPYSQNSSHKSRNSVPNSSENKFKVDNRKKIHEIKGSMKAVSNTNQGQELSLRASGVISSNKDTEESCGKMADVMKNISMNEIGGNTDTTIDVPQKCMESILTAFGANVIPLRQGSKIQNATENSRIAQQSSASDALSKYKLISKTKLIRRRSKSFSKDKMKVTVVQNPKSVVVCRPSSKFPSKASSWGKINQRRKFAILSRTKLVRRLSNSSNDLSDVPKYFYKTKTKLIKRSSNSNEAAPSRGVYCDVDPLCKYSLLSSSKLAHKHKPNIPKVNSKVYIRKHKFIRHASAKNSFKNNPLRFDSKSRTLINSRYKLENRFVPLSAKQRAAKGIISKYSINRLKIDSSLLKKEDFSRDIVSKYKINRLKKLDRLTAKKRSLESISKYSNSGNVTYRQRFAKGTSSKYRINRLQAEQSVIHKQICTRGIVSKYRINRLKPQSPSMRKKKYEIFRWTSSKDKYRSYLPTLKRTQQSYENFSDRIINIGGILYKATRTSLKKQQSKKNQLQEKTQGSLCILKLHGQEYHLSAGGRTLLRMTNSRTLPLGPSLSRVHIGGLTYCHTKSGQYELTKAHQARALVCSAKQRSVFTLAQRRKRGSLQKRNQYCIFFNRFGRCAKKNQGDCPYLHDPKKVAVCTRFLRGRCPVSNCPFSHEMDPNKMPVCSHFVRSTCNRENCPYRHVKVNPSAPLCLDFLHGYCLLGEECKKQHLLECEEFITSGKCPRGESCPLSHRKGARKSRKSVSLEPVSTSKSNSHRSSRKHKSSESSDVLGAPVHKKRQAEYKIKVVKPKRYFQLSAVGNDTQEGFSEDSSINKNKNLIDEQEKIAENKSNAFKHSPSSCPPTNVNEIAVSSKENFETDDPKATRYLEKVRERVLQKVEKFKHFYLLQQDVDSKLDQSTSCRGSEGNESIPSGNGENSKLLTRNGKDEMRCSKNSINETQNGNSECLLFYTYEREPLPKNLPSYIPLNTDSHKVE